MKLGSGIAPGRRADRRAASTSRFGTDGAASNNRIDLFGEMRIRRAARQGGHAAIRRCCPRAAGAARGDALRRARARSRRADRLARRRQGSGRDRRRPVRRSSALPCYDPVSHLVHAVGREAVTDVWVAGSAVVANRVLQTADEAAIAASARLWQERLQMNPARPHGAAASDRAAATSMPASSTSSPRSPISGGIRRARCSGRCTR